jgi:ribonuclease I
LPAFCGASGDIDLAPGRYADFSKYVLSISWQPTFCQSQYVNLTVDPNRSLPLECNPQVENEDKTRFFTVHGLWADLPLSIGKLINDAPDKLSEWRKKGCALVDGNPPADAEKKCTPEGLRLRNDVRSRLLKDMPGSNNVSCLEQYEYAKHGVCFAFDPNNYFGAMMELLAKFRQSQVAKYIGDNYGVAVRLDDVLMRLRQSFGESAVESFSFLCKGIGTASYLEEIQVSIKKESISAGLVPNAFAVKDPPDPKKVCGQSFVIDRRGF